MIAKFGWIVALVSMVAATGAVLLERRAELAGERQKTIQKEARLAVAEEDWTGAELKYGVLLKTDPEDGNAWFMLGLSQHYQGEFQAAREHFLKAEELGHDGALVHYNIACGWALQGEKKAALDELDIAVQKGGISAEIAKEDCDLESIRNEARFKAVVKKLEAMEKANGQKDAVSPAEPSQPRATL